MDYVPYVQFSLFAVAYGLFIYGLSPWLTKHILLFVYGNPFAKKTEPKDKPTKGH